MPNKLDQEAQGLVRRPDSGGQGGALHEDGSEPPAKGGSVMIVADETAFTLDCIAEAMRSRFAGVEVISMLDGAEADAAARSRAVDVILINGGWRPVTDPGLSRQIQAFAKSYPGTPIVLISEIPDNGEMKAAAALGVRGFLRSQVSLKIAVAAVQLVMAGGTYLPRAEERKGETGWGPPRTQESGTAPVSFTHREIQVLVALQLGRSNRWIGQYLGLSENTIKVYVRQIMRKLRAGNRVEAAMMARRYIETAPALADRPGRSRSSEA